jgi:hypothetical protein
MPRKIRELKADLQRAGFTFRTAKGSHIIWTHPLLPYDRLSLSGNDGDDAKAYQEKDVHTILQKLRDAKGE